MRGVGDEVALRLDRALERVERGVEGPGEPGQLVVAGDLEALVLEQVDVGRDRLGLPGEASDRRQRGAGDEDPEQGGEGDSGGRDQDEQQHLVRERPVDVGDRQTDHQRSARADAVDEHPQVGRADVDVGGEVPVAALPASVLTAELTGIARLPEPTHTKPFWRTSWTSPCALPNAAAAAGVEPEPGVAVAPAAGQAEDRGPRAARLPGTLPLGARAGPAVPGARRRLDHAGSDEQRLGEATQ